MTRSKTRVAALAAAALIIAAAVTWYVASPAWTLRQMKLAADANDPDALSSHIDYPALRDDLKAEMRAQMIAEATKDKSRFGRVGLAIETAMIGPMINGLVTPAAMREALMAKRNQALTKAAPEAASRLRLPDDPVIVRHGFSEFVAASKQQPKGGLIFRRHGLSWKLSAVDFPAAG